jgi:Right handed beta helix region
MRAGDKMGPMKLRCLLLMATLAPRAATYYVDSGSGNDANGTVEGAPWRTLTKVNAAVLHPGDRVVFRSGSVWRGQLAPLASGSEGPPIVFDRYGRGRLPHIDAAGQVEDAVRLYNVQFIEVRNLEVTNRGQEPAVRRGIHIFLDNFGTAKHVIVSDLYVHDVNGTNGSGDNAKDNGGIIFRIKGDRQPSRFDGLTIERNIVWKVDRSAIAADSYHWPRKRWFPSLHVVIRDNFVADVGGDGIVPWATDGVVVEHNIALQCNRQAGSYNAGIWPWSADNSLVQLNEAAFTHTTLDGQGFDSDFNSRHTCFNTTTVTTTRAGSC